MTFKRTRHLIRSDVRRRIFSDGRNFSVKTILLTLFSPSVMLVVLFRLQHFFYHHHLYIVSKLIAILNILLFSSEIHSRCRIDEGFIVGHANGIIFHDQTIIGKNCTIMHQVSIGLNPGKDRPLKEQYVVVEDDVLIGSGAKILGPCVIGTGARIGMNAVVNTSLPPHCFAAGVPAAIVKYLNPDTVLTAEMPNRQWTDTPRTDLFETIRRIREDLIHRCQTDGISYNRWVYLKLLLNPAAMAVVLFRLAHWLDGCRCSLAAKLLNIVNVIVFKTEIGTKADIQGGLVLVHGQGVIINHRVRIGKNAVFFSHNSVAIGPRFDLDPINDLVVIGDNMTIGAGARILGNISIGDNCRIGMNSVVTKSIPDNAVVAGVPATIIKDSSLEGTPPKWSDSRAPDREEPQKESFRHAWSMIREDIKARARIEGKPLHLSHYLKLPLNPAAMAVVLFRLCHCLATHPMMLPAVKILYLVNKILFSVEIQTKAAIGPGLVISHACGVLIHDNAIIGKNCIFTFHNIVTIGPRGDLDPINDRVVLGDNVFVGMGAQIIGNITIGHRTVIGANAVVTRSFPDDARLVGVPAANKAIHEKAWATAN
jgi:serine O-acetyltransferase